MINIFCYLILFNCSHEHRRLFQKFAANFQYAKRKIVRDFKREDSMREKNYEGEKDC